MGGKKGEVERSVTRLQWFCPHDQEFGCQSCVFGELETMLLWMLRGAEWEGDGGWQHGQDQQRGWSRNSASGECKEGTIRRSNNKWFSFIQIYEHPFWKTSLWASQLTTILNLSWQATYMNQGRIRNTQACWGSRPQEQPILGPALSRGLYRILRLSTPEDGLGPAPGHLILNRWWFQSLAKV